MLNFLATGIFFLCYISTSLSLEAAWTPFSTVSSPMSSNSQICIDRYGNAVAIWSNTDQTHTYIQSSKLLKNTTWSPPVTLSSFPEPFAHIHPQIAVDKEGIATAIWEELQGSNSIIMASTLSPDSPWTTPVEISIPTHRSHQNPKIAMSSSGYAVAIWVRNNGTHNVIESANLQYGESWTPSVVISTEAIDASFPQISVDGLGNAMAVWLDVPNQTIQSARLPFGGSWTIPVNNFGTEEKSNPKLVMNPSGCAVLGFEQLNGLHTSIYASMLQSDNIWSAPVLVSNNVNESAFDAKVAIDINGNAALLWSERMDENNTDIRIKASYASRGGDWSTPENVSPVSDTSTQANNADVAFDSFGNAYAVWERDIGSDIAIEAATYTYGGNWSEVVNLSNDKNVMDLSAHNPHVAVDPKGYAVVNWVNNPKWFNNAFSVIQATTFEPQEETK